LCSPCFVFVSSRHRYSKTCIRPDKPSPSVFHTKQFPVEKVNTA
jgi:hypothetical protein